MTYFLLPNTKDEILKNDSTVFVHKIKTLHHTDVYCMDQKEKLIHTTFKKKKICVLQKKESQVRNKILGWAIHLICTINGMLIESMLRTYNSVEKHFF